ncbi:MAG: Maf family protein [Ignavibacteriae bacterium]|nr:Maf family protein [Ignavibacteriota bacterium]
MFVGKKLILASGSPRRRHLLNQLGLEFEARESGADEENNVPNNPGDHVRILSERKARAVADDVGDGIVIGADTIVVLDGAILGKPTPLDKAGAYGIQDDYGAVFVESIHGCFYNVVGFPLSRFYIELRQFQKELGLL